MWYALAITSAVPLLVLYLIKKRYFSHVDCLLTQRLDGKTVVVTGCNQGIGVETVREIALRGAVVIMACRSIDRCLAAKQKLLDDCEIESNMTHNWLTPINEDQLLCEQLDLEDIHSISAFANRLLSQNKKIDILINNAGISLTVPDFALDGLERHLKINHLGHFHLTNLLRPLLGSGSRIIILSSLMHRFTTLNIKDLCRPISGSCYSHSKLLNIIHAAELAKRWAPDVVSVSVHPGLVATEIFQKPYVRRIVRFFAGWLTKTPKQGAQTTLFCCLSDNLTTGAFYSDCHIDRLPSTATDPVIGEKVWKASEALIKDWESRLD